MRIFVVVAILAGFLLSPAAARAEAGCEPMSAWDVRDPLSQGVDAAKLQDALDWASLHTTQSMVVVRHGCLIGASRLDPLYAEQGLDGWSMTKSVTSMLMGRAARLGLLDYDQALSTLFPEADAAHGALTLRHLATMTAGLEINWVRELSPLNPDRVRDALALRPESEPGTVWDYAQSNVTLLGEAIRRASGDADLQDFAQRELFGPVGIASGSYVWDLDRAGHREGWAHLKLRGADWARIGQLMLQRGVWNGTRLLDDDYIVQATASSTSFNPAYGLLWWLNGKESYQLPEVYGADNGVGTLIPAAPSDLYVAAGAGEQRLYVVPSRDIVIARLGDRSSREADTRVSLFSGHAGQMDHEIVRRVMSAVTDVPYADPGPYTGSDLVLPAADEGSILGDALHTDQVLAGAGLGPAAAPGCDPMGCD